MFHGLQELSLAYFLKKFPAGVCCHSLKNSAIIQAIQFMINNEDNEELYALAVKFGQIAVEKKLNLTEFIIRFSLFAEKDYNMLL